MRRIAIITGAGRGIGAATAVLAASSGYDICVNYASNAGAANLIVDNCIAKGVRAIACQADVGVADEVARLFSTCDAELGRVSLLVNNAGIVGKSTKLVDLPSDVLLATYTVNVFGAIYCTQEAIKRMAKSQGGEGGAIVNISSIAAKLGSPNEYVHYASSKAAVETLTVGLAKELGPEGIRVNCVRAGTTNTDIHATSGNPDRPAKFARTAPLGRVGEPIDMAEAILWLASDKAAFTSGAILSVAGGV
ncbi:MAG: SDR family oxidoreductase [Alphaproteobacteria bacterium]|nr:SDR family oxidoreductase [Alphaproteobacteria bacterium]